MNTSTQPNEAPISTRHISPQCLSPRLNIARDIITAAATTTSLPDFLVGGKRTSTTADSGLVLSKEEQILNQRKKEQWARNQTKRSIRFDSENILKSIVSISGLPLSKFLGKSNVSD